MTVTIQRNNSENNRLTKSLTNIATKQGSLREGTSMIAPTLIILGNVAEYAACNYVTIPAFGRSYFVTNITVVNSNTVALECAVDVLSSFKAEILAQTAVIARQENQYNRYLPDAQFKAYQNSKVITRYLSGNGLSAPALVLVTSGVGIAVTPTT